MYIATEEKIVKVPKKRRIRSLFCEHKNQIRGSSCSSSGMQRISGDDIYRVCMDCGKILSEIHTFTQ